VRTQTDDNAQAAQEASSILAALQERLGQEYGSISDAGSELVGPVIGAELRRRAMWALIIGNLLILGFLTIRYEFRVATASIVALVHDLLIMLGAMALFRVELNSEFVAAMLTIVGYSVNDSVVIFDRIRENRRLHRGADLETITNASLLQTMNRSINTVLSVLFTLFALYIFGGGTLKPFLFALLVGMTSGMYSSIFIASPFVVMWDKWSGGAARRSARPLAVAGSETGPGTPAATAGSESSAESAMLRQRDAAQEEKRQQRRDRRKSKGKTGKRRH
jgi:preprotein translocase subunit SecF